MNQSVERTPLKDLAFEAFYNELVCKASPNTVEFIRDCIDQQLSGDMKETIRDKCFDRFNDSCHYFSQNVNRNPEEEATFGHQLPDAPTVLDCILDSSLLQLKIKIPSLSFNSFSRLLSTISHRAPSLENLVITIPPGIRMDDRMPSPPAIKTNTFSLSSLESLSLNYGTDFEASRQFPLIDHQIMDDSPKSYFGIIGKCCPALTNLTVNGYCMRKKDVLGLIVGDLADILFPSEDQGWSEDSVLIGLRVPSEFLNRLCFTLEKWDLRYYSTSRHALPSSYSDSPFAFALRHLPRLRSLDIRDEDERGVSVRDRPIRSITLLQREDKMRIQPYQADFEKDCHEAALSLNDFQRNLITSPSLCYDFLSIECLAYVVINDVSSLRAIGSLCPHLVVVCFVRDENENLLSDEKLESILKEWPKVEYISLWINCKIMKPILASFGSVLQTLIITDCDQVDLAHLASCVVLDSLILLSTTISSEGSDTISCWTPKTFLPSLTELIVSGSCLGLWAPLLEAKSTLVRLNLNCCHIGTNARNPRLEWSQLAGLWPDIEHLTMDQCTGLTMDMLSDFIAQSPKLRSIDLPRSIFLLDENLFREIQDQNKEWVCIKASDSFIHLCPFQ